MVYVGLKAFQLFKAELRHKLVLMDRRFDAIDAEFADLRSEIVQTGVKSREELNFVTDRMMELFDDCYQRLDKLDERVNRVEQRLDRVEQRLDKVEQKLDQMHVLLLKIATKLEIAADDAPE